MIRTVFCGGYYSIHIYIYIQRDHVGIRLIIVPTPFVTLGPPPIDVILQRRALLKLGSFCLKLGFRASRVLGVWG